MERPLPRRSGLIDLRVRNGMSQEQLAHAVDVSASTIKNWERGVSDPRARTRPALARALGLTLDQLDRVLVGDDDNTADGAPADPDDAIAGLPGFVGVFVNVERAAARICTYEPLVIPALLHAEGYSLAVENVAAELNDSTDYLARRRAAARLARQEIVTRANQPTELHAVIDERVLTEGFAPAGVMREQLKHLLRMASRTNVTIQVCPARRWMQAVASHAFTLTYPVGARRANLACATGPLSINYFDSPGDIQAYADQFDRIATRSLSAGESAHLIEGHLRHAQA